MCALPDREQKASYVRGMFNEIADRYDLMNSLMSFGLDRAWRRKVVQRAEVAEGNTALDICCGTGMLTMELAKKVGPTGKVVGIDFSEEMLEIATENLEKSGLAQIEYLRGDAMVLPFSEDSFDAVTVAWGLRNVPDIARVVAEMRRVVKPGGKVMSLDMAKPSAPVFKQGYWLYFEKLVPLIGKVWTGRRSAYNYLYQSALEFPNQGHLAELFAIAGLKETSYLNLCGGVVAVVEGRK